VAPQAIVVGKVVLMVVEKRIVRCGFVTFGGLPWLVDEQTVITCLTLF
jgi:hypothetical protein